MSTTFPPCFLRQAVRPLPRRGRLGRPTVPVVDRPHDMAAALALLALGANMASPLFPGYQRELGFSDLTLTLVYATYAVASVPALLVLGPLGDRVGRVRLVRLGLLLASLGAACFAIALHPAWLFAGRILQGAGLGAATGAGMAVLAAAPPTPRRRLATAGALIFLLGTAAGPGLTGALTQLLPHPHTTVHLLFVGAAVLVYRRLGPSPAPAEHNPRRRRWPSASPQLPLRGRAHFLAAMGTGFVSWAVVGLFLGLVPSTLARGSDDVPVAALGLLASVVVLAAVPAQTILARLGVLRAQVSGLGLLAAGLVVLVTTGASSVPATMLAAAVAGIGHGLAYGGAHGAVQPAAIGDRAAGIMATAYVVYYLGAGIPAIVVGLASLRLPLPDASTALATFLLVAAIAAACTVRRAVTGPALPSESILGDVADLIRAAAGGVNQAHAIRHGSGYPRRAVSPRPERAGRTVVPRGRRTRRGPTPVGSNTRPSWRRSDRRARGTCPDQEVNRRLVWQPGIWR